MGNVHSNIIMTYSILFREQIVEKKANLIVLNAQAEARTWLKWNTCLPSSSYINIWLITKWPSSNEKLYHGIWAAVIKCHTSRVSVLSTESLSTILMGTSEANFWYTWMRSYNPKVSSLDEAKQTTTSISKCT